MSFSNEVRKALRAAHVPVATLRHPWGVVVRGSGGDTVRLVLRPVVPAFKPLLAEEVLYAVRGKRWGYTVDPHTITVHRRRDEPATPPPPGG